MRVRLHIAAVALTSLALTSCTGDVPQPADGQTVRGECVPLHGGDVCTWAELDGSGQLVEYGATIPLASIEGAPHGDMVWPPMADASIPMPAQVRAATGIDHLTVYWEPHGHPPGPYLTPHFDFHFHNTSASDREAIDCTDDSKPATMPDGYDMVDITIPDLGTLVGLCVPAMGMHAVPASELASDRPFESTMVMGYYRGTPNFFEPMVARDTLLRRQSFELPVPAAAGLPEGVRYPRQFRAEYDATADAYRFVVPGT